MVGVTPSLRILLPVGVAAAILFAGCFEQPTVVAGQGNTPGGFFLRVTANTKGLDPAWRNFTADFTDVMLVRETGGSLKVPPNEPRNLDLDLLDLSRRGDQRTIADIYSSNERFFGFIFQLRDLNATRYGDVEVGEPELVDVDFTPDSAWVKAPYAVFIMAGPPAFPGARFAHLVEVTVVFDMARSLEPSGDGNWHFSPRIDTVMFKVDGRIVGQMGPPEASKNVPSRLGGTYFPPIARGGAYVDNVLVAHRNTQATRLLNRPIEPNTTITFDAGQSRDRDPYGELTQYRWLLGDDTPVRYGFRLEHAYATGGLYDVSMRVADDDGMTDSDGFPVFVSWGLDEARPGGANNTTGTLVNVRDTAGAPVAELPFDNVTLELPRLAEDVPYRPGMILVEVSWDNPDAQVDWSASSGTRVERVANGTGPGPERLLLVGRPYLPPSVDVHVQLLKGTNTNYRIDATVFHVPDIEAGWDGHASHEHARYMGLFEE